MAEEQERPFGTVTLIEDGKSSALFTCELEDDWCVDGVPGNVIDYKHRLYVIKHQRSVIDRLFGVTLVREIEVVVERIADAMPR